MHSCGRRRCPDPATQGREVVGFQGAEASPNPEVIRACVDLATPGTDWPLSRTAPRALTGPKYKACPVPKSPIASVR
jgi:hypothetical protein